MEITDALRIPLELAHVREALGDLALLRASLDHCESFVSRPSGEYVLTLTIPLGALRSRYEIRAHTAGETRQASHENANTSVNAHTLSFKARGEGVGSLRGQIAVALSPDAGGAATWIEYTVWATVSGPLAGLPSRQIENALREAADGFFSEFCEVVRAKHGEPSACEHDSGRRHLFLRPAAMSGPFARRAGLLPRATPASAAAHAAAKAEASAAASGVLRHRHGGHVLGLGLRLTRYEHDHSHDPHPLGLPGWAWATMLACVALFAYFAQQVGLN